MENRELVCISCPVGCLLSVRAEGEEILVTGNGCKRGEIYGKNEVTDPRRTVTTSLPIRDNSGAERMLSLKTALPVPKDRVMDCIREIRKYKIRGDFIPGDVVIQDLLNLGIAVVATRPILSETLPKQTRGVKWKNI